jgi:flagellar hook-basal body complex protein FliE
MKEISFQYLDRPPAASVQAEKGAKGHQNDFCNMLKRSLSKVNELQKDADHAVQDLVVTNEKDVHQTMIAMEKADVSFKLLMKVRNKIISSYEEIMRMNI